jgi:photosystem II stability/assembly factor-like uncharacterized protein
MVRRAVHLALSLMLFLTVVSHASPALLNVESRSLDTPTGTVRIYLHALGSRRCDLAFKFGGQTDSLLRAFRRNCRTIRRVAIEQLIDPGYRLHPQTAAYTCLGIRYTVYRQDSAESFGGWYLMERTIGSAWHILLSLSDVTRGRRATRQSEPQCATHLPSYVHRSAGTIVSGFAFFSATTGWIALSTSGSYVPNGSCSHGIGSNCDSAPTTVYRTVDAGRHWTALLHFTTTTGPVWIREFRPNSVIVVGTVGPLSATSTYHFSAVLYDTRDGGRHWQRFHLPLNYATEPGSISFPDSQHGWLWYGGGAAGSMSVYVYRTLDGGRGWTRVACSAFSNSTIGYGCSHPSGIGLGGDKGYLTFKGSHDGWLTVSDATGVPYLYHTSDGGTSWRRQAVGLPSGVALPTANGTVDPFGTLFQPSFFGEIGLLPEEVNFYQSKSQTSRYRLYIFRSPDGGRAWRSAQRAPVTGPAGLWQAIDARHWIFAVTQTASKEGIWATDNAGASWTRRRVHAPVGLALVGIQMVNARDGWATAQTHADSEASASGALLLHTTDGGVHWAETRVP